MHSYDELNEMTVPVLRKLATDNGVILKSKERKADLIGKIMGVEHMMEPAPYNEHAEARGAAPEDIDGEGHDEERPPAKLPRDIARLFESSNPVTARRMKRAIRATRSQFYGMGGRGMGAKHFTSRSNPNPVDVRHVVMTGSFTRKLRLGAL